MCMPSASAVTHAATGASRPSSFTRHMRQAPQLESRSCWQMVGTSAPAARTASRMVAPSSSSGRPSTVTRFMASPRWRRPPGQLRIGRLFGHTQGREGYPSVRMGPDPPGGSPILMKRGPGGHFLIVDELSARGSPEPRSGSGPRRGRQRSAPGFRRRSWTPRSRGHPPLPGGPPRCYCRGSPMSPTRAAGLRAAAPLVLLSALVLAGCSKKDAPTGPRGDATGEHLVAFASDRGRAAGDHGIALYDVDQAGFHGLPGLDDAGSESDPCISNDGRFLTFIATRGGGSTGSDVYIYDRLNQLLLPTPGLNSARDESWPRFTYDSVHLAFVTKLASGEKRGRLYDLFSDSLVSLTGLNSAGDDRHPSISSDGDVIVFQSNRAGGGGQYDLYLFTRSTGELSQPAAFKDASDDIQPYLRWR